MPIYEYQCEETGDVIEELYHSANEAPSVIQHGALVFKRIISRPQNHRGVVGQMRDDYAEFRAQQRKEGIGE